MPAPSGFSRLQIALHWIVALLIAQQLLFHDAISLAWDKVLEGAETSFDPLVLAHVAAGALVLLFALWRLSIRARVGVPESPDHNPAQRLIARLTHFGLYALMILMPVSGAMAWFGGVALAAAGHTLLKIALLVLVALHVFGAIYHQFILKDRLFVRMVRAQD